MAVARDDVHQAVIRRCGVVPLADRVLGRTVIRKQDAFATSGRKRVTAARQRTLEPDRLVGCARADKTVRQQVLLERNRLLVEVGHDCRRCTGHPGCYLLTGAPRVCHGLVLPRRRPFLNCKECFCCSSLPLELH